MGCGCGSNWERILRELDQSDNDNDEAPIEVTEEFEKIEVPEEVEVER